MTSPRVLVVDDDDNIRHMLSLLLAKHGYLVDTAENGARALEMLRHGDYAAMLCDLRMPVLDGMALLAALTDERIQVTSIVMSAYADIDDAIAAIQAGAYDYVAKPFKKEEVLFTLRKADEARRLREENAFLKRQARGAS